MNYAPGDRVRLQLITYDAANNLANADSLPTGIMSRNNVDDGTVVTTVTNMSTGRYGLDFSIPAGYADEDSVILVASWSMGGVPKLFPYHMGNLVATHYPVPGSSVFGGGLTANALRSRFRLWTTENDPAVIPDRDIDLLFDDAMKALNRRTHFYVRDDQDVPNIALVAGTQEYAVPPDFVEAIWVEWNGVTLKKTSIEALRQNNVHWRSDPAGTPTGYYVYDRKIGFYPTPGSAAVLAAPHPIVRYVADPPPFTRASLAQVPSQEQNLMLYHAVASFFVLYGTGYESILRAEKLMNQFETESRAVAETYGRKENLIP